MRRPAAHPTDADDPPMDRKLVDAGHQLAKWDVASVLDMTCAPLVVLSYVEIDGISRRRASRQASLNPRSHTWVT